MPNANATKAALGESLKKLVLTKRLEKITISDLTADCGISRMARSEEHTSELQSQR